MGFGYRREEETHAKAQSSGPLSHSRAHPLTRSPASYFDDDDDDGEDERSPALLTLLLIKIAAEVGLDVVRIAAEYRGTARD